MEPPSSDTMMKTCPPAAPAMSRLLGCQPKQISQHHRRLRPRKISLTSTSRSLGLEEAEKRPLQLPHTRPGMRDSQLTVTQGPTFLLGLPGRAWWPLCVSTLLSVVPNVKPCFPSSVFLGPQRTTPSHAAQGGGLQGLRPMLGGTLEDFPPSGQGMGPSFTVTTWFSTEGLPHLLGPLTGSKSSRTN